MGVDQKNCKNLTHGQVQFPIIACVFVCYVCMWVNLCVLQLWYHVRNLS